VRLKEHRLARLQERAGFTFVRADVENLEELREVFETEKPSVVFNLAARAGVRYSMENPFVYMATNGMGTLNLLELMRDHGVQKMVLASTSSLYAGEEMPFSERLPVNRPISPYAASKKAAEAMAYSYHHLYGLDVSVVRYFTVFGPAGRPDMCIFRFIKWVDEGKPIQLTGDGSQTRDFTYVDDIASGTILASRPLGYEVINLGGGRESVSLNQIISQIEELLGKKAKIDYLPFHEADMQDTRADIAKARSVLGWQPTVGVATGLKHTVNWYLANKEWVKSVAL
jgi:nucleoside-diphosphate-sugar epimerase